MKSTWLKSNLHIALNVLYNIVSFSDDLDADGDEL